MAKREQVQKQATQQEQKPAETQHAEAPAARDGEDQELLDISDELLDEIDSLLEETTVMTNYVQRGGQ